MARVMSPPVPSSAPPAPPAPAHLRRFSPVASRVAFSLAGAWAAYLLLIAATGWLCHRREPVPSLGNSGANVAAIPASPDGSFRFAVLGDPEERPYVFTGLMRQAAAAGATFAIIPGDLVDAPAEADFAYFAREFDGLGEAKLPTFAAIGNHDLVENDPSLFRRWLGPEWFSFVHSRVLFLFVDNNDASNDPRCVEFVRSELAAHEGAFDRSILVMHRNTIDCVVRGRPVHAADRGEWIAEAFGETPPAAVLTAHYHGYLRADDERTLWISTGGAGGDLQAPGERFHMVLVDVKPDALVAEEVPLDGTVSLMGDAKHMLAVSGWRDVYGSPVRMAASIALLAALALAARWAGARARFVPPA